MNIDVTYTELGASLIDPMPGGYNHLRYETFIGYGATTMAVATQALLSFDMHRKTGVGAKVNGHLVTVKLGPIKAPCHILWTESTPERAGFTYGTLAGHPECGEESFLLTHTPDDRVWLQVRAFSRPAKWYTRLAGPLVPIIQRAFARRCGRALRSIVDTPKPVVR